MKVKETETEAKKEKVDLKENLKTRIALHKEHGNSAEVKRLEMELIKLLEEEYNSACKQLYTPSIISTPTNLPLQQLSTSTIVPTPAFSSSGLLTDPLTVQSSARTTTTKSRALKNKKKSTKKAENSDSEDSQNRQEKRRRYTEYDPALDFFNPEDEYEECLI